jgi:hypothetical protein
VLTRLASHLEAIERKVDNTSVDLGKVQEQVDLAMTSLSLVQDEQVHVSKQLKSLSVTPSMQAGDGIMGSTPTSISSASASMKTPPTPPQSPLPSNCIL